MQANLAIQLSESAFSAVSDEASALGKTPAEVVANVVECIYGGDRFVPPNPVTARWRFEQCFGSVDLGRPIGIANAAIDADLAREYQAGAASE